MPVELPERTAEMRARDNNFLREPEVEEDLADRFGIRLALLVFCVGSFLAALWMVNRSSFDKCVALENANKRYACFDAVRTELLKPPAPGAR